MEDFKDEVVEIPPPIESFSKGEIIGCGSFGQVYKGFDLKRGRIMAVKQVPILKFIG